MLPLANVTSSTKPEVHDILERRPMNTEQLPQATCTENSVKFGCVVSEIYVRQTDMIIAILRSPTGEEVIKGRPHQRFVETTNSSNTQLVAVAFDRHTCCQAARLVAEYIQHVQYIVGVDGP